MLENYYEKYLKKYGVIFPKLYNQKGNLTKDALVLVYLTQDYPKTRRVSKSELTAFIRSFYPDVNDVQQARHLGAQKGWWVAAGARDNVVLHIERGFYQLYTLKQPYPGFRKHGSFLMSDWQSIKAHYGYRCATCGSREGKAHLHWPGTQTKLQKAHMNPRKPLVLGNVIPQCQKCNMADRNRWVYDEKGRVIKIANPNVIKNCDKDIRWKIYAILYRDFKGVKP